MQMLTVDRNTIAKSSMLHDGKDTPFQKEIRRCARDELLQYDEKLANEIPDKHLLTGIDLSTGFSISLVENIVSNIRELIAFRL